MITHEVIVDALLKTQSAGIAGNLLSWLTVAGLGGLLVEGLRAFTQRKKMGADYADVISQSALRLLTPLENRVRELENEVIDLKKNLHDATAELNRALEDVRGERRLRMELEERLRRRHKDDEEASRRLHFES